MEDYEDGELPSSPDELQQNLEMEQTGVSAQPTYIPLPRPHAVSSSTTSSAQAKDSSPKSRQTLTGSLNSSLVSYSKTNQRGPSDTYSLSSSDSDSSDDDSDSDSQIRRNTLSGKAPGKKSRKLRIQEVNSRMVSGPNNGGEDFKNAVAAYQNSLQGDDGYVPTSSNAGEKRKSSGMNNVWGSILREDVLTSDLTSISVGRKSTKDLHSDRGAEAYDYSVAAEFHAAARQDEEKHKKEEIEQSLNDELGKYWKKGPVEEDEDDMKTRADRKEDAICAGKKRSVKERLGARKSNLTSKNKFTDRISKGDEDGCTLEDLSIPQPGMPRTIPDLSSQLIKYLLSKEISINDCKEALSSKEIECMEEETGNSSEDTNVELLGEELAARLCEPKTELMIGVIDLVGGQVVLELFERTQIIESEGGMMIKNGARRRTPGGVFLHLLREMTDDPRVDPRKVKQFFAQSQKNDFHQDHKKYERNSTHQQKDRGYQRDTNTHPYKKKYSSHDKRNHSSNDPGKNSFQNELDALRKLSQKAKKGREKEKPRSVEALEQGIEMEDDDNQDLTDESLKVEEEIKPLPDILTCISKEMKRNNNPQGNNVSKGEDVFEEQLAVPRSSDKIVSHHDLLASCQPSTSSISGSTRLTRNNPSSQLDNFEEPDAPPNSVERVERTVSTYEDDILSDFNTEDIELF